MNYLQKIRWVSGICLLVLVAMLFGNAPGLLVVLESQSSSSSQNSTPICPALGTQFQSALVTASDVQTALGTLWNEDSNLALSTECDAVCDPNADLDCIKQSNWQSLQSLNPGLRAWASIKIDYTYDGKIPDFVAGSDRTAGGPVPTGNLYAGDLQVYVFQKDSDAQAVFGQWKTQAQSAQDPGMRKAMKSNSTEGGSFVYDGQAGITFDDVTQSLDSRLPGSQEFSVRTDYYAYGDMYTSNPVTLQPGDTFKCEDSNRILHNGVRLVLLMQNVVLDVSIGFTLDTVSCARGEKTCNRSQDCTVSVHKAQTPSLPLCPEISPPPPATPLCQKDDPPYKKLSNLLLRQVDLLTQAGLIPKQKP